MHGGRHVGYALRRRQDKTTVWPCENIAFGSILAIPANCNYCNCFIRSFNQQDAFSV